MLPAEDLGTISTVSRRILEVQGLPECQRMIILAESLPLRDEVTSLWVYLETNFTFCAIVEVILYFEDTEC